MLETTGCDLVMLGRAAFGDPWVFRRLRAHYERGEILPLPTASERLEAGVRHLKLLVTDVGEAIAAKEMRKHVAWYIRGLPHSHKVREQVNQTRNAADLAALLTVYLETLEQQGLSAFAPENALEVGSLRAAG
jgi:tRNA-dihydrouridine synthase B